MLDRATTDQPTFRQPKTDQPKTNRGADLAHWPGRDAPVRLADGRCLLVRHYGREGGRPVLMLHGTPGSRILWAGTDGLAQQRGLHIIAPDRWAYGGSDAPPAPSLAGYVADMAELMDRLAIERFAVAGVSGGGPYAVAIAALLPARVTAAALISPVGLVREATRHGEVDALHRFCFHVLPRSPRVVEALFRGYASAVRHSARLACGLTTARAPAADKAIMADCATSDRLLAAFREGLRQSARGPAIDLALFRELDALDLTRAALPARVWIGGADRNVPVAAARRLAARLPEATLTELPGAGHLWIAQNYALVLDWLLMAFPQR